MSTAAPPVDTNAPTPVGTAPSACATESAPAATEPAPAAAVPAPAAAVPMGFPTLRCDNCSEVISGRYCSACGQRVEAPVHSLWHFTQVAVEDMTHADSRLWRTLSALLFKPGFLTREFLAGRRASYLPPVRLYLVISVVFFLLVSATHGRSLRIADAPTAAPATSSAPKATAAEDDDDEDDGASQHVEKGQSGQSGKTQQSAGADTKSAATPAATPAESREQRAARVCHMRDYHGPKLVETAVRRMCVRGITDPQGIGQSFLHNLPRAMFVFLPLLAAAMTLLYWRPRRYYVAHLLLLIHNHAFVFLALVLTLAADRVLPFAATAFGWAVFLYMVWYVYRSMRVVYGQGRWLTGAKLVAMSGFYFVSGVAMLAITALYSALTDA